MQRAKPTRSRVPRAAKILGVLTVLWGTAVLTWGIYAQPTYSSDQPLEIWMFDVGQGDALFIEMPTGEQLLIDGGPSDTVLSKLGAVLAPWDRSLDGILLTHPDADHGTGLISVLENYQVEHVYETGVRAHTQMDRSFVQQVEDEQAVVSELREGDVLAFGEVTLEVLSPAALDKGNRNDSSIVLLLEYGETSMLLMGDAEKETEQRLQRFIPDVDILKVGHHGSLTSSTWNFLEQVRPEISLISAGRDNRYGHPHPIVIDRLNQLGSQVYQTNVHQDVYIRSWGAEPEVRVSPLPF